MPLTQDKTGRAWKITGTTTSATEIWDAAHPIWIDKIVWASVDTAGDDLLVVTGAGEDIIREKAIAGDSTNDINYEYPNLGSPFQGLTVTTMDSGILYIYVQ